MSSASTMKYESLTLTAIESSTEIQAWLAQIPENKRITAKTMLSRLRFISHDVYATWFQKTIQQLPSDKLHALYSVRKLNDSEIALWNSDGSIASRPGVSLGSEDFVYSLVANVVRANPEKLFDHSSLTELRDKKIRDFVLIDDSIGSGVRVSGFINAMLNHPTFLSWWSFGFVRIHVITFARPRESESRIIDAMRGSDHGIRKFRKSSKIDFTSEVVYNTEWLESRWGDQYTQILELCESQTKIPKWARYGYGEVMANRVFYHSVPNNIPGLFWFQNEKWKGLFTGRALPDWMVRLLNTPSNAKNSTIGAIPQDIDQLLSLIKLGVRSSMTIATRLNCDHKFALALLAKARELRLLSDQNRLTFFGFDRLKGANSLVPLPLWDRSLYIPSSWSVGQTTIQPPVSKEFALSTLADSTEVSTLVDGDIGQMSLERSDVKAATPPSNVMLHTPAMPRENHDADGPLGSKER